MGIETGFSMQLRELLPVMHHGCKLDLLHPPFDFQECLLTAQSIPNTLYACLSPCVCVSLGVLEFRDNQSFSVNSFKTYSKSEYDLNMIFVPFPKLSLITVQHYPVCFTSFQMPANRPSVVPLTDPNLLGPKTNDETG